MQCPRCGCENPQDSQVCSSCSFSLYGSQTDETEAKPKRKTRRIALLASLPGIMAVASVYFFDPIYVLILALIGLGGGVKAILEIRKGKAPLWGKILTIAIICFSCVLWILMSYWKIDAPPITNDYTINDIRSAPAEFNHTYDLLNSLGEADPNATGAPSIGLSEADIESLSKIYSSLKENDFHELCEALDANAAPIMQLWQNSKKGRAIINELDTFPEIADLTEPQIDAEFVFIKNLRSMTHIYRLYVCLHSLQGNGQAALGELLELDSVCTKIDRNARSLPTKLVCMAMFGLDIRVANFIANNPQSTDEVLEAIAVHFESFSESRLSMRNPVIFEHLTMRNSLTEMVSATPKAKAFYKFNSTLRLHRNYTDERLALETDGSEIRTTRFSVWPSIYPELPVWTDSEGRIPWYYRSYNPVGSMLLEILLPAMERISQIRTRTQIYNDLLRIVLNERLGKAVSLKARAYGDEYIVDVEGKKIFSPGPDGEAGTKDDISLPINPLVLGWDGGDE